MPQCFHLSVSSTFRSPVSLVLNRLFTPGIMSEIRLRVVREEWDLWEVMIGKMLDEWLGSLRVTSSKCYNGICKVEKALNLMSKNVDPHLKGMALSMEEKIDKYWEGILKINKLFIVANILDA